MAPPISYKDVSDSLEAELKANHAPELRDPLLKLGFQRVGLLEAKAPNLMSPEQIRRSHSSEDAELLIDALNRGEVVEILTSPDQQTFAIVEKYFGGSLICLRTMTEDAQVYETVMTPARPPEVNAAALMGIPQRPGGRRNLTLDAVVAIMEFVMGKPSLWVRQNSPHAHYYVELVDTRDSESLWNHHQQRIKQAVYQDNVMIRPHDSLAFYLAISQRAFQIIEFQGRLIGNFSSFTTLLFLALAVGVMITSSAYISRIMTSVRPELAIIVPLFLLLMIAIGVLLLIGLFQRWVKRFASVPKTSAEILFGEARQLL